MGLGEIKNVALAWVWQRPTTLVLEGDRLRLRPLTLEDGAAMFLYASDPEVTKYLPWEPAMSAESVRPFLAEQVWRRKQGTAYTFGIIWKETGELIGSTSLMGLSTWRFWRRQAELGYILRRDFWGRGVMTEAAQMTLDFAFRSLRVRRVYAWADTENTASCRVLEKIGMQFYDKEERIVNKEKRAYHRYEVFRPFLNNTR
jgi:[ribosomal protein S5]-alanine N-acetyltransferase